MPAKRCAVYVRLSKLEVGREVEATSIPRQVKDCRSYAELRGWEVAEVYEDVDQSAYRRSKRAGYERMLSDVRAGLVDVIVVWKLDRLLRRAAEFERVWSICEAAGAELASVNDSLDTSHATGRAIARMLVAMAQLESEQMSLRIRGAKQANKAAGKPRSGGPRAFGLTDDWSEVVPAEQALVREAAERVLAGASVRSVVLDWNERGVTTSTGGPWSAQALRNLLLQERICPGPEARWPALLDEVTCARLRAVLTDPARRQLRSGRGRPNLLTGTIRCGRCGARMKASQPAGGKRKYACPGQPEGSNCTAILAEPLEAFVVEALLLALDGPSLSERLASNPDDPAAALAEVEAQSAELAEMWAEGKLPRTSFEVAQVKLSARADAARAELAEAVSRRSVEASLVGRWDDLDLDGRRQVVQTVLDRVVVNKAQRKGPGTTPAERVDLIWKV